MKIVKSLSAAFLAALMLFVLSACGGGGGDSSPTPTTVPVEVVTPAPTTVPVVVVTPTPTTVPVVVVTPTSVTSIVPVVTPTPDVPVVVTVTCPNGTVVPNATGCSVVGTAPITLQGSVMSPIDLDNGVTIKFNGDLVSSSVTVLLKQGNSVLGSTSTIAGNKDVTFKPNVRLAYGQSYSVLITATDTIGRTVEVTLLFSTSAMVCTSNAIWSNPATYSTTYQNCVAPIGVQALVTPSLNTMTDASCVPTAGTPLTEACKAYMANGTILLADTSVIVQNNPTVWMAYVSADGKSNLVLLDATTFIPIGTMVLPNSLVWEIGNPTGAAISEKGLVVNSNEQITWNGSELVAKCYKNCPI